MSRRVVHDATQISIECMRTSRKLQGIELGVWDVSWTGKHGRDKVGTRASLQLRTFSRCVYQCAYIYTARDDVRVCLCALWTELFSFLA